MSIKIRNKGLYDGLMNKKISGRRTKKELIKIACCNAYLRIELEREIEELKHEIQKLRNERSYDNANAQKIRNERGAGRKPVDERIVEKIKSARMGGSSIREIAKACSVSVGTVHNVLKASGIE